MTLTPYHQTKRVTVYHGDCLDVLRQLPDDSVHAVITDPPYGLAEHPRRNVEAALLAWLTGDREHVPNGRGFMGRDWDAFVPPPAVWDECFRVLRPGGHLLAFCGSRTFDLMAMSIRLAGLTEQAAPEIRDSIAWLYGSGFPKSLDVSRAIDKAAGAQRETLPYNGKSKCPGLARGNECSCVSRDAQSGATVHTLASAPATPAAQQWAGWGTALKPSHEPVICARKPLAGTVAANVLAHGTGALNIDACRVGTDDNTGRTRTTALGVMNDDGWQPKAQQSETHAAGRWPANVALDTTQAAALDQQSGTTRDGIATNRRRDPNQLASEAGWGYRKQTEDVGYGGEGGASRFFPTFHYTPKAPTRERPAYVDDHGNTIAHPTVKPVDLFAWLIRLVVPPGGTFIDPFAGSGASGEAATREQANAILIERDESSARLIARRLDPIRPRKQAPPPAPDKPHQPDLFDGLGA